MSRNLDLTNFCQSTYAERVLAMRDGTAQTKSGKPTFSEARALLGNWFLLPQSCMCYKFFEAFLEFYLCITVSSPPDDGHIAIDPSTPFSSRTEY